MKLSHPLYLTGMALTLGVSLQAQSFYWDTNGATPGAGNPADGDWDGATANWTTDSTGASATSIYTPGSDVVFSAGSDAATANVNVVGTQKVNSLTFKNGVVTIDGDTVDNADGVATIQINVNSGASGILESTGAFNADFNIEGTFFANAITAGGGMTKNGAGTATFNRLDATLVINEGRVVYTGLAGAKLKNTTVNDGGTLEITGNAFESSRSLTVSAGGQFVMGAGVADTISLLNNAGSMSGGAGSVLTIGYGNNNSTISGAVTDSLSILSGGTGSLTMTETSSMVFTIGANGVNNSILGDAADLTTTNLDGEFQFDLTDADLSNGNSWLIVDTDNLSEVYGATFNIAGFTESSGIWTYDSDSNLKFREGTGELTYVIPEPGTYALLFGLAVVGIAYRRRQGRR